MGLMTADGFNKFFTVAVLTGINLLNYMDRFTIAGECYDIMLVAMHVMWLVWECFSIKKLLFGELELTRHMYPRSCLWGEVPIYG